MSNFDYTQTAYYGFLEKTRQSTFKDRDKLIEQLREDFPILSLDQIAPVGIYILDMVSQSYPYVSRSLESVLGYKAEDLYAGGFKFIVEKVHPDDLPIATNQLARRLWET